MSHPIADISSSQVEDTERATHNFRLWDPEAQKGAEFSSDMAGFHDRLVNALISHRLEVPSGRMLLQVQHRQNWVQVIHSEHPGIKVGVNERIAGARATARGLFRQACAVLDAARLVRAPRR